MWAESLAEKGDEFLGKTFGHPLERLLVQVSIHHARTITPILQLLILLLLHNDDYEFGVRVSAHFVAGDRPVHSLQVSRGETHTLGFKLVVEALCTQ